MTRDKNLSMLCICAKAGAVSSGEFATEQAIKKGKARLVLLAGDASANTKDHFHSLARYYQVPIAEISDKETLGGLIGKGVRSNLSIDDEGLARAFAAKNQISMELEGGNA